MGFTFFYCHSFYSFLVSKRFILVPSGEQNFCVILQLSFSLVNLNVGSLKLCREWTPLCSVFQDILCSVLFCVIRVVMCCSLIITQYILEVLFLICFLDFIVLPFFILFYSVFVFFLDNFVFLFILSLLWSSICFNPSCLNQFVENSWRVGIYTTEFILKSIFVSNIYYDI